MCRSLVRLVGLAAGATLVGCGTPPPTIAPSPPILKLTIHPTLISTSMPSALSTNTGGSTDGLTHTGRFDVQVPGKDGGRTFHFHGDFVSHADVERVPDDRRRTYTLTAASEVTTPVRLTVEYAGTIRVELDGEEVFGLPVELTPGSHRVTITGRFPPVPPPTPAPGARPTTAR